MPDDSAHPADGQVEREQRVRVAAYVVCTDDVGRVLLARWVSPRGPRWTLPGGGLDAGEQPPDAALRELTEETGYVGQLDALVGVDADRFVGVQGIDWHAVRVIYRARVVGGDNFSVCAGPGSAGSDSAVGAARRRANFDEGMRPAAHARGR